jgi:hypothetical protein
MVFGPGEFQSEVVPHWQAVTLAVHMHTSHKQGSAPGVLTCGLAQVAWTEYEDQGGGSGPLEAGN